jgi:hypothetical protein
MRKKTADSKQEGERDLRADDMSIDCMPYALP